MVVFNLYALVVAALIGVFVGPLYYFAPTFMEGSYGNIVAACISLVVSTIGEFAGLSARLFWIPIWFWSLGALGYFLYDVWGWWGPGGAGALAVGAVVALILWTRKGELEEWERAPRELEMARALVANEDAREQCFAHLHKAFFSPGLISETERMWAHQREVLAVAGDLLEGRTQVGKEHLVRVLEAAYAIKIEDPSQDVDSDLTEQVSDLIEWGGHPPIDEDDD